MALLKKGTRVHNTTSKNTQKLLNSPRSCFNVNLL